MRFALACSCGKDSVFALHKMLATGHDPVCLITMFRKDQQRSWFHGADREMLKAFEKALGIPMFCRPADVHEYAAVFEQALIDARARGAEACVFGDMDLEENRLWEEARCRTADLASFFPLWEMSRNEVLEGIFAAGYKCVIKTLNLQRLPQKMLLNQKRTQAFCERWLGKYLDRALTDELETLGLDPCGENGEYHTLVVDGPVFRHPLQFRTGKILYMDGHATIEMDFRHWQG